MSERWAARRERLIAQYGAPAELPRRAEMRPLLRALGVPDAVDPGNVFAWRYPCMESAKGFAEANRRRFGHVVYGPFVTESGVVAVVHMSKALGAFMSGEVKTDG